MPTEKEKMLSGDLYNAMDYELVNDRTNARLLFKLFNNLETDQLEQMKFVLKDLMPNQGIKLWIEPPFYCDYGYNIILGNNVYFNFNCTILDVMRVQIGNNVLIGPAVQIYTSMHPINFKERASGLEFAKPVTIGNDVFIGGGAIICPGVTIGNRSIIGAGSVVTKNIPDDVLAVGNPCKIIRSL